MPSQRTTPGNAALVSVNVVCRLQPLKLMESMQESWAHAFEVNGEHGVLVIKVPIMRVLCPPSPF